MDEMHSSKTTQTKFDYSGVPPGIREHGLFCLFRIEKRKPDSDRLEKIPYRADGRRADSGNREHFLTFDKALEAYETGKFDGIGIGNFGSIVKIDVDDCVREGMLDERGQDIVDRLDTFTELSPSGTGIHAFVLAKELQYSKERYYINNRKCHVEVYVPGQTNRFLTLTGNCIHGTDVEERSDALQAVLEKYMVRPGADSRTPKAEAPGSFLSDESVLQKMFASGREKKPGHSTRVTSPLGRARARLIWLSRRYWHSGAAVTRNRWTGSSAVRG